MTSPTASSSPATDFAVALLAEFIRRGVRDVVLCPGSRSQALALAAAEFERRGDIRLRVRIDERSAAFLALGLAEESGRPALVITTSGTAVANLHPAVLEAFHSAVPLIVVSADRPEELRGVGANQATRQPGMFGFAATLVDVAAPTGEESDPDAATVVETVLEATGPVHLNLAFREPLSGAPGELPALDGVEPAQAAVRDIRTLDADETTIVVAGHAAGPEAEAVARELGAPLIAEVSSGAHFGPHLVVDYRRLLKDPEFGGRVRRAIVFGHPTLSREIPALIGREDVETIVVRSGGEDYNPGHRVRDFADAIAVGSGAENRSWVGRWVFASRRALEQHDAPPIEVQVASAPAEQARFNRQVIADLRAPITRRRLVEAVWRVTWPHDRLVLGASRLIRELDAVAPGKKIRVHANRGLAGIDGTIATGVGVALASQGVDDDHGVTRVLLGDLALLHDAGSLLFPDGEVRPRIQVIVGNDNGGTIFDGLEVRDSADAAAFRRVMLTPQHADLAALAATFGWTYRLANTRQALEESLTPTEHPTLIEVPLA
jgi:2-succinyl-5-enolpyruvyl-6-hydroxy-3-cyclohexene-1-carboxylate synthase